MSQWLTYKPTDPAGNLVASWHSYNFNTCATEACWNSQVAPVIARCRCSPARSAKATAAAATWTR